jgi:diguanylate cyclase (GGDEF)-like protein
MLDTEQGASAEVTAAETVGQAESESPPATDLTRLRWRLAAAGAILVIIGASILSVAYAADVGQAFHALNGLILVGILLTAYALASVSHRTHAEQERRRRAHVFIDSAEMQDTAMRDYLTQLFNRYYFFKRLGPELERARSLQTPLAILMLDVDQLDAINDAYGRKAGDVALAKLGKLVLKCTRATDIPARLGDDEFGVIMPETDRRGAFVVATRIRRTLEVTPVYEKDGHSIKLTVSLGVSAFPWDGKGADDLVQKADACMYVVKAARHADTDAPDRTPSEPSLTG